MQQSPTERFLTPIFERAWSARRTELGDKMYYVDRAKEERADLLTALNRDGFVKVEQAFPTDLIKRILAEMNECLRTGINVNLPRIAKGWDGTDGSRQAPRLTMEQVIKGEHCYRDLVSTIQIKDPLITSSLVREITFSDLCLDLAGAYLDCFPAVGFVKWFRSYANSIPAFDTQYFHIDKSCVKMLKAFTYLNDVGLDGGPFCYVRGSVHKRSELWEQKDHWTIDEMKEIFGEDNVIPLTGKAGDILFADTTGFHCGLKPEVVDRNIIIYNYGVHPEYTYGGIPDQCARARRFDIEKLSDKQRLAADQLEIIDD